MVGLFLPEQTQAASQPFSVSGSITELRSVSDYNAPGTVILGQKQSNGKATVQQTMLQGLDDIRYYVIQGQFDDGKYHYPLSVKAQIGIQVTVQEIAINSQDNTQLVAVGIPRTKTQVTPATVTATNYDNSVLNWYDPVGIVLVNAWADLSWSYNGSTASVISAGGDDGWFAASGWYAPSSVAHISGSGSTAWSESYSGYYQNNVFCHILLGGSTYIDVYYVEADGTASGQPVGYVDTSSSGDCNDLIFYSWTLRG
jgi:hypothetical protein